MGLNIRRSVETIIDAKKKDMRQKIVTVHYLSFLVTVNVVESFY
jgi:hypothetical protein